MAKIDTLVFDKTGTITYNKKASISYEGKEISEFDLKTSNHYLKTPTIRSLNLYDFLETEDEYFTIEKFTETAGKGYEAEIRGKLYKIGSASFTAQQSKSLETAVYIKKKMNF